MKTIKKAYEELNGDLNNCLNSKGDEFLFINAHSGVYLTLSGRQHESPFKLICTVEEFNNYLDLLASNMGRATQSYAEYKALYNSVMGGGQAGGRGGNGIPRPIQSPVYTQEMADAGVMPSVGMHYICEDGQLNECIANVCGKVIGVMLEHAPINGVIPLSQTSVFDCKPLTPPITLIDGECYQFNSPSGGLFKGYYIPIKGLFVAHRGNFDAHLCTNIKPLTVEGK